MPTTYSTTTLLLVVGVFFFAVVTAQTDETSCPEPFSVLDLMCTADFNPVLCDAGRCEYGNGCVGTTAGFENEDCCVKCPNPEWAFDETPCEAPPDQDERVECARECEPGVDVVCQYESLCFAEAAGLAEEHCSPVSKDDEPKDDVIIIDEPKVDEDEPCPDPFSVLDDMMCTAELDPVLCDAGRCEYSNGCESITAGFVKEDCCMKCPMPEWDNADPCDAAGEEVECTRECEAGVEVVCEYQSLCFAEKAGLAEENCSAKTKDDNVIIDEPKDDDDDCPKPVEDGGLICTANVDPVLCNDGSCEYSNGCVAENAGFIAPDACCVKCPAPTFDAEDTPVCDLSSDEEVNVTCERECQPGVMVKCDYDNLCFAVAAGLTEDDCDVMMMTTSTDAPMEEQGGDNVIVTTTSDDECPETLSVNPDTLCADIFNPVLCGDAAQCEYSNNCYAGTAGFDEFSECCVKCPAPTVGEDTDMECDSSADKVSVTCERECQPGSVMVECEYESLCLAVAAGLTEDDCIAMEEQEGGSDLGATASDDECPDALSINPDTLCAEIFNPVLCGDEAQCEYENDCVAGTAGFTPSDCCVKCPDPFWVEDETPCELVEEPVECERECTVGVPVKCEYMNLCYAQAAGLEQAQCKPVDVPTAPEDDTSTADAGDEVTTQSDASSAHTAFAGAFAGVMVLMAWTVVQSVLG